MGLEEDDDDFSDFMSRVNDVTATIEGLKTGTIDAKALVEADEARLREERERQAKKERKAAEARLQAEEKRREAERMARLREEKKDELEALKRDYYLRKAKRERWEAFRTEQQANAAGGKGFSDYYRGWDLFEEDPDEDLFSADNPAAVQDQAAFDAMAKDVEQRTAKRKAEVAAAGVEKERGNAAFKANQYGEALAAYSRAIEHHRGDKAVYANRALAHIKLRNFLSAVEDASRAIEISTYLDEDASRRPPPKPLLKAYVRRATARAELGLFTEAEEDLKAAAEMVPEKEKVEIGKQMAALRAEIESARREAAISTDLAADLAAAGGEGAASGPATEEAAAAGAEDPIRAADPLRVREILDALQSAVSVSGGGSDAAADPLLDQLSPLLANPKCRLCLRQAGGIALLVRLLPVSAPRAALLLTKLCGDRRAQLEVHQSGGTTAALRGIKAGVRLDTPAVSPAAAGGGAAAGRTAESAVQGDKGARRVAIEEVGSEDDGEESPAHPPTHTAAGPPAPSPAGPPAPSSGVLPRGLASVTAHLRLLTAGCSHPTVSEGVRRAAAAEETYPRLVRLLALSAPPENEALASLHQAHGAAAALVGALSCGVKSKALISLAAPLSAAIVARAASVAAPLDVRMSCATAIGNLSTSSAFRTQLIQVGGPETLLSLARLASPGNSSAQAGDAKNRLARELVRAEALLPNTLAALNNLSLLPEGMAAISAPEIGPLLVPWLVEAGASRLLRRRALAVLAKGANRSADIVAHVLSDGRAVPALTRLIEAELGRGAEPAGGTAGANAEVAAGAAAGMGGSGGAADGEAGDEAEAEALEDGGGGGMLGNCVRLITACARDAAGPPALCDAGALPLLAAILRTPAHASSHGNAALAVAECATEPRSLAVLAVQAMVPPLLDMAHRAQGQAMKNAAIALARLAKNEHCLNAIREAHGIEILARAMKGDVAKTMARG